MIAAAGLENGLISSLYQLKSPIATTNASRSIRSLLHRTRLHGVVADQRAVAATAAPLCTVSARALAKKAPQGKLPLVKEGKQQGFRRRCEQMPAFYLYLCCCFLVLLFLPSLSLHKHERFQPRT